MPSILQITGNPEVQVPDWQVYSKKLGLFSKGKMKHNFFKMHFLLVPFSPVTTGNLLMFSILKSDFHLCQSYSVLSQWKFLKGLNVLIRYNVKY